MSAAHFGRSVEGAIASDQNGGVGVLSAGGRVVVNDAEERAGAGDVEERPTVVGPGAVGRAPEEGLILDERAARARAVGAAEIVEGLIGGSVAVPPFCAPPNSVVP